MVSNTALVPGVPADFDHASQSFDAKNHVSRECLEKWNLESFVQDLVQAGAMSHNRPVVTLSHTTTVAEALQVLASNNILSAPVVVGGDPDADGGDRNQFLCFIDVMDILQDFLQDRGLKEKLVSVSAGAAKVPMFSIMKALDELEPSFTAKQLIAVGCINTGQIMSLEKNRHAPMSWIVRNGFLGARTVPTTPGEETTAPWSEKAVTRVCHRLACFNARGHFEHVISQWDVVEFLHRHPEEMGATGGKTLHELGLDSKDVVCVDARIPAVQAFALMHHGNVSGAAIVSGGQLVGNISVSDIRGLLPEHFGALGLPVLDFLDVQRNLHEEAAEPEPMEEAEGARVSYEVIQLRRNHLRNLEKAGGAAPPAGAGERRAWMRRKAGVRERAAVTCTASATLSEVVALVVEGHLHRVYVTEGGRGLPQSVVTLTDLLRAVAGDA